jgi:hypothetical protein
MSEKRWVEVEKLKKALDSTLNCSTAPACSKYISVCDLIDSLAVERDPVETDAMRIIENDDGFWLSIPGEKAALIKLESKSPIVLEALKRRER